MPKVSPWHMYVCKHVWMYVWMYVCMHASSQRFLDSLRLGAKHLCICVAETKLSASSIQSPK